MNKKSRSCRCLRRKELKTTIKISESEADNAKDHKRIVSLKVRETNFEATNLSEEERKDTEVKSASPKSIIGNRKNTAPRYDGTSYREKTMRELCK